MKISVCIPTYNQAPFIEQCINSVLTQSADIKEIIVANDCSTDSTPLILQQLARTHKKLQIITREVNLGITRNTDDCLRRASGDFIIRLDSDDYLHPKYAETLAFLLERFPQAGYAHCAIQEVSKTGEFLRERRLHRKQIYWEPDVALREAVKGYRVAANIIMFRKQALFDVGYLKSLINFAEDYYLTASISSHDYGNVYCNELLGFYRVWNDAGKVRQKRKLAEIQGLQSVFEDVIEPAFEKKHWSMEETHKARERFAKNHSRCLGWDVYSKAEKKEVELALLQLSSTRQVKMRIALNKTEFVKIIELLNRSRQYFRNVAKRYLAR